MRCCEDPVGEDTMEDYIAGFGGVAFMGVDKGLRMEGWEAPS